MADRVPQVQETVAERGRHAPKRQLRARTVKRDSQSGIAPQGREKPGGEDAAPARRSSSLMRKTRGGAVIEVLREHLSALPTGDISAAGQITALLPACWNEFAGSGSERMHAGKLGRMEDVRERSAPR